RAGSVRGPQSAHGPDRGRVELPANQQSVQRVQSDGCARCHRMFAKVLIANRGAIACRIIRTLRRMGIRSIAVFSEADAGSLHVAQADEAICIGAAAAASSYLNGPALIAAARDHGAQAIHPGYGFLSENAEFAAQCESAGLVFVGPTPENIRAFGL